MQDREIVKASLEFSLHFLPMNSLHRPRLMAELKRMMEQDAKFVEADAAMFATRPPTTTGAGVDLSK